MPLRRLSVIIIINQPLVCFGFSFSRLLRVSACVHIVAVWHPSDIELRPKQAFNEADLSYLGLQLTGLGSETYQ